MQHIPADHPLIRYVGRIAASTDSIVFSHPGVSVEIRFTGTTLRVVLDDFAQHQAEDTTNYFNVIVDNEVPIRLKTEPSQKEYILAENLAEGAHAVVLFKRSESSHGDHLQVGKVAIRGFKLNSGAKLLSVPNKPLKMEFIGDSITCGYGNELSVANPVDDHFTTVNSNAYMAWGAIAARELDADYVAVAYSGRGVVRNYAGHSSPTIPDIYLDVLPDDPATPKWDPQTYVPNIVVINLGTNDFSEGLTDTAEVDALEKAYTETYETFLRQLLSYYPDAQFVLAHGPMLSNGFPPEYKALTRVKRALSAIQSNVAKDGFPNVFILPLAMQQGPFGEDFHPTIVTHQRMAKELVAFIRTDFQQTK